MLSRNIAVTELINNGLWWKGPSFMLDSTQQPINICNNKTDSEQHNTIVAQEHEFYTNLVPLNKAF